MLTGCSTSAVRHGFAWLQGLRDSGSMQVSIRLFTAIVCSSLPPEVTSRHDFKTSKFSSKNEFPLQSFNSNPINTGIPGDPRSGKFPKEEKIV